MEQVETILETKKICKSYGSIVALKDANLVTRNIVTAKIMLSGELTRPLTVRGLSVTKGARAAIEAAGGKIEE